MKGRTRRIWDHPALEDDDVVGDGLFYVAYSVESGETTEVMAENCRVLDVNSSNLVGVCMADKHRVHYSGRPLKPFTGIIH